MKPLSHLNKTAFSLIVVALLVGLLFTSCSPGKDVRQSADTTGPPVAAVTIDDNLSVGEPFVHENLAVFPVTAKQMKSLGDFITLDEATEKKLVSVTELGGDEGGGAAVEALTVENKSDMRLFLLSGEVVYGGKQNRVIRHSVVIAPGDKSEVPVRCVESGRWSRNGASFGGGGGMKQAAPAGVRSAAQKEKGAQQETWNQVHKQLHCLKKLDEAPTRSLSKVLEDKEVRTDTEEYFKEMLSSLQEDENVVGIVVSIDGRIIGSDTFCSHELFKRYAEKLLRSYSLEALCEISAEMKEEVVEGEAEDETQKDSESPAAPRKALTAEQARDYLLNIRNGKAKTVIDGKYFKVLRRTMDRQQAVQLSIDLGNGVEKIHENSFEE
jgi:hypothetical protein